MKKTSSIVLGLLLACMHNALAQKSEIKGKVVDEQTQPLMFANVLLLNATDSSMLKGAVADTLGGYHFENINEGKYLISVRMMGYENAYSPIQVTGAHMEVPTIQVKSSSIKLDEVEIRATKPMIELTGNAVVMNVSSSPILSNGTAYDVLVKSPGVVSDKDGKLSLKGKANVNIMIDGKMTYLSAEEVIKMLQNTNANNIEKVEIIQNPSAKYDASGNAGIINITMKKDANLGYNGSISLNAGYGWQPKAGAGINLNYKSKKIGSFFSYNHNYRKSEQSLDIYREMPNGEGQKTIFDQSARMVNTSPSHTLRTGLDIFLSPKTTVGVVVSGSLNKEDFINEGNADISGFLSGGYDELPSRSTMNEDWDNIATNLNIRHNFKKASLTFDADYSQWNTDGNQSIYNGFNLGGEQNVMNPYNLRMKTDSEVEIKAFKADYTLPLPKEANLEMGVKSSFVTTNNVLGADTLMYETNQWVNDAGRTNTFEYDENINAAYINYSKNFKKFNFSVGLRAEHTISDGNSITTKQRTKREYINLFPSFSLNWRKTEKDMFALSYSRRIDRPNYNNLNPFEYVLDKFTYQKGNPFLKPQYTDSYSLNYMRGEFLTVELAYSRTQDAMMEYIAQKGNTAVGYATTANIDNVDNYSLTVGLQSPITKWWMMNANLTGMYNKTFVNYEGYTTNLDQWSGMANVMNNFTLPHNMSAELTVFYLSPSLYSAFKMQSMYQVDAGLSKSFPKQNLKLRMSLSDIFDTRIVTGTTGRGDFMAQFTNKRETRVFRVNLSYNFGNTKLKASRKRSTSIDDVMQRVGK